MAEATAGQRRLLNVNGQSRSIPLPSAYATFEQVFLDLDERVLAEQIRVAQRHGVQHLAVQIISAEAAHTHALSSLRSQPANEIRVRIQIEAPLMVEGLQVLLSGAEQSFAV